MKKRPYVSPRILVLEGLYADTAELIDDAGGIGIEVSPWKPDEVRTKLKSGTIDGILLTGGSDVNPALYGEKPSSLTQSPDYTRDACEMFALNYAREHKIPVLGICRGSQIMCVSQGGRLVQDIQAYTSAFTRHNGNTHEVVPAHNSRIFKQICLESGMEGISLHHQCVERPGLGMRIAAYADDGTPEAIESKDGLMLGVQFHPEMTAYADEKAFNIFRWLVKTAAERRGGRAYAVNFLEAAQLHYERISCAYMAFKTDQDEPKNYTYEGGTTSKAPSGSGSTRGSGEKRVSRKAGDPAIPSMRAPTTREMVQLIESSTGQQVIVTDENGNVIDTTDEGESCPFPRGSDELTAGGMDERPFNWDESAKEASIRWGNPLQALERSLRICPACGVTFDCIEDCDDHKKYVHPIDNNRYMNRFPEMQPPPGHPDWDSGADVDQMAREMGLTPASDWEDIDN